MDDNVRPLRKRQTVKRTPRAGKRRFRTFLRLLPALIVFGVILAYNLVDVWVDILWFDEVGQRAVYLSRLSRSFTIGLVGATIAFVIVLGNLIIARSVARRDTYIPFLDEPVTPRENEIPKQVSIPDKVMLPLSVTVALIVSTIAGLVTGGNWTTILRFFGRTDFGVKDARFHHDASFYVFTLPFVDLVVGFLSVMTFVTIIAVTIGYFAQGIIRYEPVPRIARRAVVHIASLGAFFFVLQAVVFRVNIWKLVSSESGIATGAGYTDLHARLPMNWVMVLASLVLAVLLVHFARKGKWRAMGFSFGGWVAMAIVSATIVPAIVQGAIVSPNEIERERPVLQNNIKMTRYAYGLGNVAEKPFKGETGTTALSSKDLANNQGTMSNVRLWDPTTLREALHQLQSLRSFYEFKDVDVDRYEIDGQYRQTMLSVREIDPEQVQGKKTWVNQRLQYTHGYGLVGAWVNRVTPQGLPDLFIKNIPPEYSTDLKVKEPAIYFGEMPDHYVIVNSKQKEFDYPEGDASHDSSYEGNGGIAISGGARRLAFAIKFRDPRMFLTKSITSKSRFMFRRNVRERVEKLAPFVDFDSDAYVVALGGKLLWVIDGYTTTDRFPYSQHNEPLLVADRINYVRNSVKATVDAFTGEVHMYAIDEQDPILRTWRDIFPSLFQSAKKMPDGLRAHLRYPEDLFNLQSGIWSTYHMKVPRVFYNKDDRWDVPEVGGRPLDPFYVLARLPGEKREEMVLMRPMSPAKRSNMIAWMGARMDPGHYGELLTYELPKNKQVYGPAQIEARIDQAPEISQQINLWEGQGASVIRGNLLVFPIEQSLLYVQPVYLESNKTQLPELRRVIVAFGDTVVWGADLKEALNELYRKRGQSDGVPITTDANSKTDSKSTDNADLSSAGGDDLASIIKTADEHYTKALECQKAGDWECYGREIKAVGDELDRAGTK